MAIPATVTGGFTFSPGEELTSANLDAAAVPTVTIPSPISVANGGTGSANASDARTALGLGTIATQSAGNVNVTGGTMEDVLITLASYAVSGLPPAAIVGRMLYCTDGNAGSACVAVADGSNWKVVALGATVST